MYVHWYQTTAIAIATEAQIATGTVVECTHWLSKCVWQSEEGGGVIKECTPGGVRICNNSIILPKTCAQHFRENYPVIVAINYLCVGGGGTNQVANVITWYN